MFSETHFVTTPRVFAHVKYFVIITKIAVINSAKKVAIITCDNKQLSYFAKNENAIPYQPYTRQKGTVFPVIQHEHL
jgi:hypothetical protein